MFVSSSPPSNYVGKIQIHTRWVCSRWGSTAHSCCVWVTVGVTCWTSFPRRAVNWTDNTGRQITIHTNVHLGAASSPHVHLFRFVSITTVDVGRTCTVFTEDVRPEESNQWSLYLQLRCEMAALTSQTPQGDAKRISELLKGILPSLTGRQCNRCHRWSQLPLGPGVLVAVICKTEGEKFRLPIFFFCRKSPSSRGLELHPLEQSVPALIINIRA